MVHTYFPSKFATARASSAVFHVDFRLVQPIVAGRGPQLLGGVRDRLNLKLSFSNLVGYNS
ncbi:hypothetical protein DQG23_14850 [Paenibacillus contaminans]|uniref:Uncharacterized protein n=1 Tax=Paenibacillus contaminans TaxID=450362 RepID=A0A329MLT6_9BACL|nr:hypothetical protein DQG23_14850 [Paenibacillus contaminans]